MAENKKPAIRFKGFTDAWEQRELLTIVDVLDGDRGKNYPAESDFTASGHTLFLNASNVTKDGFSFIDNQYISENKSDSMGNGKLQEDDIVVTSRGSLGHIAWYNADIMRYIHHARINSGMLILRKKTSLDSSYLYQFMKSHKGQEQISFISFGSAQPQLTKSGVEKLNVDLPSDIEEQTRIGSFFLHLDTLITLHQRKYDKLVKVKKSMLEKMFPKNGSKFPEVRFKGFTDAWEQRELGECFSERVESMPNGELISVTINDGIKKFSELGRHDNSNDDKSKYKKVCVGDIAYNSMRMWQGASGYSPYEGIVSPAYTVLSPNDGVYSKCVAYQFKLPQMIHIFQINSQGITSDNWNLKYPTLSEIEIYISSNLEEQKKIAELFTNLDNLITLHQRKLEKLKNIKKSMLQKMFL